MPAFMTRRWCFTLNNYTDEDCETITKFCQFKGEYSIVGKELGENNTPHLQGYFRTTRAFTLNGLKKALGPRVHFEPARGTEEENFIYCSKGQDLLLEVGCKRSDNLKWSTKDKINRAVEILSSGGSLKELLSDSSDCYTVYLRHSKIVDRLVQETGLKKETENIKQERHSLLLRTWQHKLIVDLQGEPDARKIIWYVDFVGNTGKSWLTKTILAGGDSIAFENSRGLDIKHAYNGQKIAIFDLTRSQESYFNYGVLESIKNGVMFSSKYESQMKLFKQPHVVVFANWPPDTTKLSEDRWDVRDLWPDQQDYSEFTYKQIVDDFNKV